MTLEEQLIALAKAHDLSSISVQIVRQDTGKTFPTAYAQADGLCGMKTGGGRTMTECLVGAIADLNSQRAQVVECDVLPALEGASA
jgi:hypothetical protein